MCFSIPVRSSPCRLYRRTPPLGCNPSNLVYAECKTHEEFRVSGSIWIYRSAVIKVNFISVFATFQSLSFFSLKRKWITPENTSTRAALSSSDYVFSFSLRASGHCDGGTDLLISLKWRFSLSIYSFEFHAVTVTCPLKLNIIVIYCPPGALGEFLNELHHLII